MNKLLTRAKTMINPPSERIIWCYKRWQPLFSEMQSTIKSILFMQGFPENLNDDSFIDTRYPSLIVSNDLMRDATNSNDVCELFVEGNHHRNISVACILQNRFSKGKENRGMSINKGNNKITELRAILQREIQNSQVYKQTKSVNNRKTVKT